MPLSLDEFNSKYGYNIGATSMNPSANVQAPTKAPKSSFFGGLANSAINLPQQAIGALYHTTVDPFARLAGDVGNTLKVQNDTKNNDLHRAALTKQFQHDTQAFKAGSMSRADFAVANKKYQDALSSSTTAMNETKLRTLGQSAGDAALAIGTVATLGAGTLAKGAAQAGLKAGAEKIAGSAAGKVAGFAGKAIDGTIGSGQTLGKNIITQGASKLVRNAVVTQPTIKAPVDIAKDLKTGDYAGAAGNAALLALPAGAVLAGKGVKALKLGEKAFGRQTPLSEAIGSKRLQAFIDKNKDNKYALTLLKRQEMFTANQRPGFSFAEHLTANGVNAKTAPVNKVLKEFGIYAKQVDALDGAKTAESSIFKAGTKGVLPETAVVSHDYRPFIAPVIAKLQAAGGASLDLKARLKLIDETLAELGNKNGTIASQLKSALVQADNGAEMAGLVKPIIQKNIIKTPKGLLDKGFIATHGPKDRAAMPSVEEARNAGSVDAGVDAHGVLGGIATGMKKVGLGLDSYNPKQIVDAKLKLTKDIRMLGITRADGAVLNGDDAYKSLDAAKDALHLTDIRHLSKTEIQRTLGDLSNAEAKQVKGAIKGMYDGQSKELRGFAGKLMDKNLKYNPIAARYGRIQGKLRYDLNPSFRAQQKIEAASIGQISTGGHAPMGDVSSVVGKMRENGLIPGMTKNFDEAIGDIGPGTNITTNLTASEENSLARVLKASAEKNGTTIDDELKNETTRKIMRAIVQNPKEGFHSSNFAKAMNIAVFPLNYNIKVTGLAVKALASQPKAVQFGVAKSIADFHSWTKTDEGVKWKSDNSEMLGMIAYFTPINSITQIMQGLGEKDINKLGLLGGLPFGLITRVLQGQGIWSSGSPYINPKTGEIVPDQLPTTTKARLQIATADILNTMFTFPGRTAGLGSKKQLLNSLTGNQLVPGKGETESRDRSGSLTKDQLNTQRVLQTKSQSTIPKAAPISLKPGTVTSFNPVKITPIYKAGSAPKAPKKKVYAKRPGQPF